MTMHAAAATLASPAEWAGLAPADRARYLAALNPLGLGLFAAILAAGTPVPPTAVLAFWAARGLIDTADAAAAATLLVAAPPARAA